MTPTMAFAAATRSVSICAQLGLVGRVFADTQEAFAITEGPTDIVKRYFDAVSADALVRTIILHSDMIINTREFSDYSVWLSLQKPVQFSGSVKKLTPETLPHALPAKTSVRLKMMIEAYLKDGFLKV